MTPEEALRELDWADEMLRTAQMEFLESRLDLSRLCQRTPHCLGGKDHAGDCEPWRVGDR